MKKWKLNKLCVALLTTTLLGGCATGKNIPENINMDNEDNLTEKTIKEWSKKVSAVTYVDQNGPLVVEEPLRLPANIRNMPFSTTMNLDTTMASLAAYLEPMGLYVVIPEKELADKKMPVFNFKGKLGDFLNAIGVAYGVSFNWNPGNIVTVESMASYMLRIPQDETLAATVSKNLESLGAEDVDVSVEAGTISYRTGYRSHQRILNFLERLSVNSALVSLQVAVINVSVDRNRKTGIDWQELNMTLGREATLEQFARENRADEDVVPGFGHLGYKPGQKEYFPERTPATGSGLASAAADSDDDSSNSGEGESFPLPGLNFSDMTAGGALGGQESNLRLAKGDFSFSAAIDYLSTYGETETRQSLILKTLSGKDVKIKSGQKVPYIESIGISGDSESGEVSDNSMGQVKIEEVDIGLDLQLLPYFESDSELVTINVSLELSSLLSFIELSAGRQVGSVTRPNVQSQEFTDVVKIKAGESVIIGGITYDKGKDNTSAPSFMERWGMAHSDIAYTRNSMFIMIRPTVTVFGNFAKEKEIVRE